MQEAWPERGTGGKSTEAMLKASSSTFFDCDEAPVKDLAKYYALGHERGLMVKRPTEIIASPNNIGEISFFLPAKKKNST